MIQCVVQEVSVVSLRIQLNLLLSTVNRVKVSRSYSVNALYGTFSSLLFNGKSSGKILPSVLTSNCKTSAIKNQ